MVTQMVNSLPVMPETRVSSMGQEDPLEKGMATYSSLLAWRIPWTEEPRGLQSMGFQRVRHDWLDFHFHFFFIDCCIPWNLRILSMRVTHCLGALRLRVFLGTRDAKTKKSPGNSGKADHPTGSSDWYEADVMNNYFLQENYWLSHVWP